MKRKPATPAAQPIVWPRADPIALASFDPATKRCEMNCGPSSLDPRSAKERKFLCGDCFVTPNAPDQAHQIRRAGFGNNGGGLSVNTVIVYPRGQLTQTDRMTLKKAGIVAVEADDPSKVVTALPMAPLVTADDLLMAMLHGITRPTHESASGAMVSELHRRLKAKESVTPNAE